jgi:phenylalanyl-tRNA synthetase beta chain
MATSKRLGLRSEASARFERQLHPDSAMAAQRLAARLMVQLAGARLVPGTIDEYPSPVGERSAELRLARLEQLLGEEVPADQVVAILERLGFGVTSGNGSLSATIPSWRQEDVQREVDLIEEVARIHGLDNLPATLPARRSAVGGLTPAQRRRRRAEDALRDRGLAETVSYSFSSPDAIRRLRVPEGAPAIANPLSEDQSVMRPTLLTGLLDALAHNAARGRDELGLFESAHTYGARAPEPPPSAGSPGGAEPAAESHRLAGVLGLGAPQTWRSGARPADFYAARSIVDAILDVYGVSAEVVAGDESQTEPFLHPGRSAVLMAPDRIGWLGEIHPLVLRAWDLDDSAPVAAFEVDLTLLGALAPGPAAFRPIEAFPPVMQDIAVVVPGRVPAAAVQSAVLEGGGELLASARLFDLYEGDQVGAGNKSLALRLEFRAPDRTLTDDDVAARRAEIEKALEGIGGRLRA